MLSGEESVAVALQVVNAARLMAALLHNPSFHLRFITARLIPPLPLLLSGHFRQETFEAERVFHSRVKSCCFYANPLKIKIPPTVQAFIRTLYLVNLIAAIHLILLVAALRAMI